MTTLGSMVVPINPPGASTYNGTTGGYTGDTTNIDGVILIASGAQIANAVSANQSNDYRHGVVVFVTTGAFGAGNDALKVTIQGIDPVSNATVDLLTSNVLAANATVALTVYPSATPSNNATASAMLPKTWRVVANAASGTWGSNGSILGVSASVML